MEAVDQMRLVFMGSPAPVITPLKTILEHPDHQVVGVISQPARPVGRKGILTDPPLAQFAKEKSLPILQPEKASAPEFLQTLKALKPDLIITAAYGQILSDAFLEIPARGTINIHPSLLPAYRGATPVPAALLDGLHETGVTILFTIKKLDAGAIVLQKTFPIKPEERAGSLTDRLFAESGPLLLEALSLLQDQEFKGTPQEEAKVTFCGKIKKSDGQVNWEEPASMVHNRFRAYDPWPGLFSFCEKKRVALIEVKVSDRTLSPGEIEFSKAENQIHVGCGQGSLGITRLKPAGGKEIDAMSFWNGIKDKDHAKFTLSE